MSTKYTPGPWKTLSWGQTIAINSNDYMGIAHINAGGDSDKGIPSQLDRDNARLIAAAPELLEALQAILTAPDYMIGDIARAAIAKATK
jgi:hypothetical protein